MPWSSFYKPQVSDLSCPSSRSSLVLVLLCFQLWIPEWFIAVCTNTTIVIPIVLDYKKVRIDNLVSMKVQFCFDGNFSNRLVCVLCYFASNFG